MNFYSRNDILYVRLNGKRVSTKLKDTKENRKLVMSYHKNDAFFNKFNINKDTPLFLDLCQEVLEEKEKILKSTSYYTYQSIYKTKIEPFFKDKYLTEVTPILIEQWYKTFKDRSSIITCESILKVVFEKSILRGLISTTPLIVTKPKFKRTYEKRPFSIDEVNKVLKTCKDETLRNFLGLCFFSGLRNGEALGLKWADIDFKTYTLSVNRTITNGFIQSPKTESSKRIIDILPQCEEFLRKQQLKTGLSDYIFLNKKGKTFRSGSDFNHQWKILLKECNLEKRGLYQTRHTFASVMLNNSESLLWVSATLGHKDASITLSHYAKFMIPKRKGRKTTFLDGDTKLTHFA